jgi:hypothetical protein
MLPNILLSPAIPGCQAGFGDRTFFVGRLIATFGPIVITESIMKSFLEVRPGQGECAPDHLGYIDELPPGNVLEILKGQSEAFRKMIAPLSDGDACFRYAPGKWSIKEVVGHLNDTERIFCYRALCIARGDRGPFPPFDENEYVTGSRFHERSFADLTMEFGLIRKLTYSFFSSLNEEEWLRTGIANNHEYSIRAIAHIIAGHLLHHMKVIESRYLPGLAN